MKWTIFVSEKRNPMLRLTHDLYVLWERDPNTGDDLMLPDIHERCAPHAHRSDVGGTGPLPDGGVRLRWMPGEDP